MDEKLMARLESAVARLESLSLRRGGVVDSGGDAAAAASDPSILAFDNLMGNYFGKVSSVAEKVGGQVLEVTKVIEEAFNVQKELLIQIKQTQVLIYFILIFLLFVYMFLVNLKMA